MSDIGLIIPFYNNPVSVVTTVESALAQHLDAGYSLYVSIVDDGSDPRSLSCLQREVKSYPNVTIFSLPYNQGRSAARNEGARRRDCGWLVFVDSDCVFSSKHAVMKHVHALQENNDVSFGVVSSCNRGFWGDYQRKLEQSRIRDVEKNGDYMVLTSANFAIRRDVFFAVEGFDEKYRKYGFEDRDFIARLLDAGARISFNPDISVYHDGDADLGIISAKMKEAGEFSSGYFMGDHMALYLRMPYSKVDTRIHPLKLAIPCYLLRCFLPLLVLSGNSVIAKKYIHSSIKRFVVRLVSAGSYMVGTYYSRIGVSGA